jgi:hypothetical protein
MTFFEKFSPERMDRKTKEAIIGFQMLSQESSKEGFNIKIRPYDPYYTYHPNT